MSAGDANVVHLLRAAAERHPDRPALEVAGAPSVSFGELAGRVGRLAAGYRRAGLAPGDRALVMIPMSAELYAALLGLLQAGGAGVFVDPWVGRRRVADFAALAGPAAFVGTGRSHLLRLLDPRLREVPLAVTTGRRLGPLPAPRTLAEMAEGVAADAGQEVAPREPSDPALVTFTTGSSGAPKGANRTHGFLRAQHRALQEELPYRDDDVDLTTFPVFALNNLARGLTTVVPDVDLRRVAAADPRRLVDQMTAADVTTATASPPLFDRLAGLLEDGAGARGRAAGRLRRLVTGGAPVADAQLERWLRAFPATEIVVVYGSTEAEPVARIGAEERLALAAAPPPGPFGSGPRGFCAGRFSPRIEARLIRIERGPVVLDARGWSGWEVSSSRDGEVGELVVTGEHVCREYVRSPEATAEAKIAGPDGRIWHRMGDTGWIDREGRFWLVGRVHSTIVRDGRAIHPQLVEQAAAAAGGPGLRRAAAVGVPDLALGERVVLVLEAEPGDRDLARRARRAVEDAGWPVDRVAVQSRALPVDPRHNSKVDYGALRRQLQGEAGGA